MNMEIEFYPGFNHSFYKGYTIYRIHEDNKCKYYAQDNANINKPKSCLYDNLDNLKMDIDNYRLLLK